jgi:hypothetical protein
VFASAMAVSSVAKANTVQFDVSGIVTEPLPPPFTPPPPTDPFSGTMMIDVTVGIVTAADIKVQGFSNDFADLTSQSGVTGLPPLWQIGLSDGVGDSLSLFFTALDGAPFTVCSTVPPICTFEFFASLTGFSGSTIDDGSLTKNGAPFSASVSGSISPTATPIPAALPLFATGIGGLGLLGWRRKRKG